MKVLIDKEKLLSLIENNIKLYALDSGGVDNWEWYDESINDFLERESVNFLGKAAEKDYEEFIEAGIIEEVIN